MVFNPNLRLTAEQALKHKYVQDFIAPEEEISCEHVIKISIDDEMLTNKDYKEAIFEKLILR